MKVDTNSKKRRIVITVEEGEPWEKVLEYIEALTLLIEGQKEACDI